MLKRTHISLPTAFLWLLLSCGSIFTGFSQYKYEREQRIKLDQVPQLAQDFMAPIPFSTKVKWYKEYAYDRTSVEAKTKYRNAWHSIEFSDQGALEDIEIRVAFEELPEAVQTTISDQLHQTFRRYKIRKVQLQYTGDVKEMQALMTVGQVDSALTLAYELVVKGIDANGRSGWEFLFSDSGALERKSRIITRNTDHLEF